MAAKIDLQSVPPTLKDPTAKRDIRNSKEILSRPLSVPIIVVQDEESLIYAQALIDGHAGTIANGNHSKFDWSPLHGRDVFIWPSPTDQGYQDAAALGSHLYGKTKNIGVISNVDQSLAQAADSRLPSELLELMKSQLKPIHKQPAVKKPKAIVPNPPPPSNQVFQPYLNISQDESVSVTWETLKLDKPQGGAPYYSVDNASRIIQMHPRLKGKIWYDRFTQQTLHSFNGTAQEWTDDDDTDLAVFIQGQLRLPKFGTTMVSEAVNHAARCLSVHSLQDWLKSLMWDNVERLDYWLNDITDCGLTEYTMAVSRNFPIAMVARAFSPGCQADCMLILEGDSGIGKSTFLKILGGQWFKVIKERLDNKDFFQAIQGAWLIEFPDMSGFSKTQHNDVISVVTTQQDVYRPSYGRRTLTKPRVALFAASSETDQYLEDDGGARRFWPIVCKAIDRDNLIAIRDQLFAEAVVKYRAGHAWDKMPLSAKDEQLKRIKRDVWTDKVLRWVEDEEMKHALMHRDKVFRVSAAEVLDGLGVDTSRQTDSEKGRVSRVLKKHKWVQSTKGKRLWRRYGEIDTP